MHDHNNDKSYGGIMWMMIVCCLILFMFLFGGVAFFKSVGYGWVGIALVLGFVIFHFRHMFGSHNDHN